MQSSIHEAMTDMSEESLPSLDHNHMNVEEFMKSAAQPSKQSHVKKDHKPRPTGGMFTVGSPGNRPPVSQRHRLHLHKIHVKTAQPTVTDADPMFALDGFTDDCEPFFESEEEDLSSSGKLVPASIHPHPHRTKLIDFVDSLIYLIQTQYFSLLHVQLYMNIMKSLDNRFSSIPKQIIVFTMRLILQYYVT
jgi:hypothetical protein